MYTQCLKEIIFHDADKDGVLTLKVQEYIGCKYGHVE